MSITLLLSVIALVAVLGVVAAIFVGGAVYVRRVRRDGTDSVLAGARKRRELRD
ncbi:hypothetical protein [Nocardiopsis quinghaiensis]|uniref:hypothetical protein n=1 Tax=Nocardiopsis quinghaiensis TaxID=464995 RepID=UPI001680BE01|nr:hypothetical protein [Nocardiopsis quinghaiensis]